MISTDSRSTPSILLATIASDTARFVCDTLQQAGFDPRSVATRSAFLHALEHRSPDLALIDARIAGGFEWCSAVPRKLGAHGECVPATPVVMICDPNEIAQVREVDAADYVAHPLTKDALVHRVGRVLEIARTRRLLETHRLALASTQRLAAVGTWEITIESDTIACSDEARRMLGWDESPARARATSELLSLVRLEQRESVRAWIERVRGGAESSPIELHISCDDRATRASERSTGDATSAWRTERDVRLYVDRVEIRSGRATRVCGLVHDITDHADPGARGAASASDGELHASSGLPSQEQFLEHVARSIAHAQPPHDQLAILGISLDFENTALAVPSKRQACLAALTQRMKASIRDRDTLCHLGSRVREISLAHIASDEFAILLPGFLRAQDAYKVACRIQESLARPIDVDGTSIAVRTQIGIAVYPSDSNSPDTLLKAAQSAMQAARQGAQKSVQFFTASMNASAFERMTLETDLRKAIEREELFVYYQPKVDLASGMIVGVEALLRWQHPELGLVSPAQFIPIAEETGLIIPIGEFVLRAACAQNKRWQDQGLPPIRMAVNLSTVQFRDPDLQKHVTQTLRATGLAPTYLELELTESVLAHKADATIATLHGLKDMGVHLSIDDFGTGYSSLSYLKRFPIDSLKIDQSFIREVTTNTEDAAITTSIILMGKSLKLKVVAEGVESPSQLALLKVLECDEAQGYLFSRPVPADELAKLLTKSFAFAERR